METSRFLFSTNRSQPFQTRFETSTCRGLCFDGIFNLDVETSNQFPTNGRESVHDLTIDNVESRFLAVGETRGNIQIYDTGLPEHEDPFRVEYQFLGQSLYNNISVGARLWPRHEAVPVACIQWYPVDNGALAAAYADNTLRLCDTRRNECVDNIRMKHSLTWIAMSQYAVQHNLIAVAHGSNSDGFISLVDPVIGAPTLSLVGGHTKPGVTTVLWETNSAHKVISGGRDGRILFWDIRWPGRPVISLNKSDENVGPSSVSTAVAHAGPVLGLTSSPDGMHLLSCGSFGDRNYKASVRMWSSSLGDTETPFLPAAFDNETSPIPTHPCKRPLNCGSFSLGYSLVGYWLFPHGIRQQNLSMRSAFRYKKRGLEPYHYQCSCCTANRIATAAGPPGAAWGAVAPYVFVPAGRALFIALAAKGKSLYRLQKCSINRIRACAWNDQRNELYTGASDGSIMTWSQPHNEPKEVDDRERYSDSDPNENLDEPDF